MVITKLLVEGFKSIRDRVELELRPLTVLAGANSSGKSSVMQPLLLFKQTFEATYDPGPLLITGPNVAFSEVEQMFWNEPAHTPRAQFTAGFSVDNSGQIDGVEVTFVQLSKEALPLAIDTCTWTNGDNRYSLSQTMSQDEIEHVLPSNTKQVIRSLTDRGPRSGKRLLTVRRERSFYTVALDLDIVSGRGFPVFPELGESQFQNAVLRTIHVPGLRGNPRRTYTMSAVADEFPGLFHEYVASVIAGWSRENKGTLARLGIDLRELGLTWKVAARPISDTEVEIRVGRLPSSTRGGSYDTVSIADVGFGVSQVLPVVVALLAASRGQLVYIEQPEIHLHPRAQIALAGLLQRAVQRGVRVVVETHSELLLLGIQRLVADAALEPESVVLHWFERDRGATRVHTARLDEQGSFGDWPVDFGEVSMSAMRSYLEAAAPKR